MASFLLNEVSRFPHLFDSLSIPFSFFPIGQIPVASVAAAGIASTTSPSRSHPPHFSAQLCLKQWHSLQARNALQRGGAGPPSQFITNAGTPSPSWLH